MHLRLSIVLAGALGLSSCAEVGIADQPVLGRAAMKVSDKGAYAAECTLVGQVERGRSLSNASSGGGCSSCH